MKLARKILSLLLACLLVVSLCVSAFAAETEEESEENKNRYNVVFVTDESGSMGWTDPNAYRYNAIRRFVALMAQEGNYVGSVTFDDQIMDVNPVKPISGFSEKEALVKDMEEHKPSGDTNIGLALMEAVNLLDQGKNPELPSVIILLSDGNTDLKPQEAMDKSLEQKAEAIELARQHGYQIYTISLNTDGSADNTELEQIAKATGGEFREVKTAGDLEEVQVMYYKMIFGAVEGDITEDMVINSEGYAEKEFDVPGIGVEELNILLEGNVTGCTLTDAQGKTYTEEELKSMTMGGDGFQVIKVEHPVGGTWKITVTGGPNTHISFRLLYNSDFYITTSVDPAADYRLGQKVTFKAVICDRTGSITEASRYAGFTGYIKLTINGKEETKEMELRDGGFFYELELKDQGTYFASMSVSSKECSAESDKTYEISVGNAAPVPNEEAELTGHANIWPVVGGTATIDLSDAAIDPDGDPLTYEIVSSAFMEEDYTLEGRTLTVNKFSIAKGSFTIRISDPYGAYCTVEASVTSTNVGVITAILVVLGILIALIAIAVAAYNLSQVAFMGTITAEVYDSESYGSSMPVTITPGRGKLRLEALGLGNCGLPAGSYFQAGGKKKNITFVSKKPVYSDVAPGANKKIVIDGNGLDVLICVDQNMTKGIRVNFQSMLNNNFQF